MMKFRRVPSARGKLPRIMGSTARNQLRVGVVGCGFWARFQIQAWSEVEGVRVTGLNSLRRSDAEAALSLAPGAEVYDRVVELAAQVDLVDIIASVPAHRPLVETLLPLGVPVVCQKPLGATIDECESMTKLAKETGTWLAVHENWRYQAPFRAIKDVLEAGEIGAVHRARLTFSCSFDVFLNQPALATAERFIVSDVGCHVLDTVRYLFGEAAELFALNSRVNPAIAGEDVSTILLRMESGAHVTVELSYASPLEDESFPATYLLVEGKSGSLRLGPNNDLSVYVDGVIRQETILAPVYDWVDPRYALVQSSIVACHRDLVRALGAGESAATSAADNLRTMRLVEAAYLSAASGLAIAI